MFFRQIAETEKNKNLFVSPSSVAVALAMTYNGARGDTQKVMEQTLKLDGMTMDDVNRAANAWLKAMETPTPKVEVSIGNSIWVRNGVPLQPRFTQRIEQNYEAKVTNLDFSKPDAAGAINAWVKGETKGKIKDIVASPISDDKVLFLINALYFKGRWTTQFDPKQTRDAPFTLLNGTTVNVPTMSRTGDYETKNGDGYQAVRLPYGDGRFSMYVFVPAEGKTVHDLAASLTSETWSSMTTGFGKRNLPLLMPKFTFKYDITLNETLKAMGMAEAFDPGRSDLGEMVDAGWLGANRLYISEVKHKTFVEVNEEGTEAAAATSVGMSVTSMPAPFAVDRPFLTAIHDGATNTVLFLGIVLDPRQG
jgi:serpin B